MIGSSHVIVGDGVRIRETPDLGGKVVGTLNSGELVSVDDETEQHFTISNGKMKAGAGYKWMKVRTESGLTGWAFGEYVAEFSGEKKFVADAVGAMETRWFMKPAHTFYEDPEDEIGFEDRIYPVFFDFKGVASFVETSDGNWYESSNSGVSPGFRQLYQYDGDRGEMLLEMGFDFQEGGERGWYYIHRVGDHFEISHSITSGTFN